jgi:hypothetical protein
MRERDHSSACEGERTLREDWLVMGGSWRHAGAEELPCELMKEWRFLGLGIPVKQLTSWRKGMGVEREREKMRWGGGSPESKVSAGNAPRSKSWHQMLGKPPLTKKAHEKSLTSKSRV